MNELMEIRKILRKRKNQENIPSVHGKRSDFATTKKMQNPPIIMPNYGKRKSMPGVPKTKVSRVLLYDNVTQQHMLDVKRANIKIEKERTERLFDLHIRSFTARSAIRRNRRTSTSTSATTQDRRPSTKHVSFHRTPSNISEQEPVGKPGQYSKNQTYRTENDPANQTQLGRFNSEVETVRFPKFKNLGKRTFSTALPKLQKSGTDIALSLKTRSSRNRLYYSSDESGLFLNLFPMYKFYTSVTEDPRFTKLESLLAATKLTT